MSLTIGRAPSFTTAQILLTTVEKNVSTLIWLFYSLYKTLFIPQSCDGRPHIFVNKEFGRRSSVLKLVQASIPIWSFKLE